MENEFKNTRGLTFYEVSLYVHLCNNIIDNKPISRAETFQWASIPHAKFNLAWKGLIDKNYIKRIRIRRGSKWILLK